MSFDAQAKLKKTNITILCSSKQNNQEFNAINHKSNFSNIKLNNCSFFIFQSSIHLQKHESKYHKKLQQIPCILRTQKHNKTQQSYGVFQNPENWILITHRLIILNTKKLEFPSH